MPAAPGTVTGTDIVSAPDRGYPEDAGGACRGVSPPIGQPSAGATDTVACAASLGTTESAGQSPDGTGACADGAEAEDVENPPMTSPHAEPDRGHRPARTIAAGGISSSSPEVIAPAVLQADSVRPIALSTAPAQSDATQRDMLHGDVPVAAVADGALRVGDAAGRGVPEGGSPDQDLPDGGTRPSDAPDASMRDADLPDRKRSYRGTRIEGTRHEPTQHGTMARGIPVEEQLADADPARGHLAHRGLAAEGAGTGKAVVEDLKAVVEDLVRADASAAAATRLDPDGTAAPPHASGATGLPAAGGGGKASATDTGTVPIAPGEREADSPMRRVRQGAGVVLLVEDEAPVRIFASRALRLRGFTVIEAGSAEDALQALADPALAVDVFVTDVTMPGMDGPTWVRKALEERPGVRVVFVSGYTEDSLPQGRAAIPESVFLAKPFSLDELTRTVQRQLH